MALVAGRVPGTGDHRFEAAIGAEAVLAFGPGRVRGAHARAGRFLRATGVPGQSANGTAVVMAGQLAETFSPVIAAGRALLPAKCAFPKAAGQTRPASFARRAAKLLETAARTFFQAFTAPRIVRIDATDLPIKARLVFFRTTGQAVQTAFGSDQDLVLPGDVRVGLRAPQATGGGE